MAAGVYVAQMEGVSVSASKTLVELGAPSTGVVRVLRAWIGNTDVETSNQLRVQILRQSASGTGTSFTPKPLTSTATAGATCETNCTAEGTAGNILVDEGFNILNGWLWVPTPEERIIIPPSGFLGLKLASAPASAVVLSAGFIFEEIG